MTGVCSVCGIEPPISRRAVRSDGDTSDGSGNFTGERVRRSKVASQLEIATFQIAG